MQGWKFLVLDTRYHLMVRNMSNSEVAHEAAKPFVNYIVKPVAFTKSTSNLFKQDYNDEKIYKFNPISYQVNEVLFEPPDEFLYYRNIFNKKVHYISRIQAQMTSRIFEVNTSTFPEIDLILFKELDLEKLIPGYTSEIILNYAVARGEELSIVLQELNFYKKEYENKQVRLMGLFRKYSSLINRTFDLSLMEKYFQEFLEAIQLDRIQ